jgi:hypothetical protein
MRGGYSAGGFLNGDQENIFLRIGTRPSKYFSTSTGYSYYFVELPEGSFSVNNLNQRFDVSLTPQTLINSVVQWNDLDETVGINLRFNWIYRPGSDLFVVYNHSWNAPELGDLSTRDRAIIVKFTYLFQF